MPHTWKNSPEDKERVENPDAAAIAYYLLELDDQGDPIMPIPRPFNFDDPTGSREGSVTLQQLNNLQVQWGEDGQDLPLSEFSAQYLPVLYATWVEIDTPLNPHASTLNAISHLPYLIRFATQMEPQLPILRTQAHRMATASSSFISRLTSDQIGEMCQFLSTLMLYQDVQNIPNTDRKPLLANLRRWKEVYRGEFARNTTTRCIEQLEQRSITLMRAKAMRKDLETSLMTCGADGCNIREKPGSDGSDLPQCSRCKTARYCSPAHQRAAWKNHKKTCFPVTY